MTKIKVTDGADVTLFRCNLSQASSPLQYWSDDSESWVSTQYQCADCRHDVDQMAELARTICAGWAEMPEDGYTIDWEIVE